VCFFFVDLFFRRERKQMREKGRDEEKKQKNLPHHKRESTFTLAANSFLMNIRKYSFLLFF